MKSTIRWISMMLVFLAAAALYSLVNCSSDEEVAVTADAQVSPDAQTVSPDSGTTDLTITE
jgi:multidrug resistance efflux pump